jgi:hypothetical protein
MRMEDEGLLAKGIVEKIGSSDAIVTYQPEGRNKIREIARSSTTASPSRWS